MNNKEQWDARAKQNAMYWVLTEKDDWKEEDFYKRGEEDVGRYVLPFLKNKGILENSDSMVGLDIGCGLGRLTKALQPFFFHVIGVDISSEIIKQAQEKLPSMEFHTSQANSLPLSNESVDYVFSFISFQHFPSKKYVLASFQEVRRVLKKGGIAQIQIRGVPGATFRSPAVWMAWNRLWVGLISIKRLPVLPWVGIFGYRGSIFGAAFKEREIKQKLLQEGFRAVETWHENPRHLWVYLEK